MQEARLNIILFNTEIINANKRNISKREREEIKIFWKVKFFS